MSAVYKGSAKPTNSNNDSSANTYNTPADLLILHVDVNQGESTLIIEREGGIPKWCCIIDGGYGPWRGLLMRYLANFEISVVDLMVCSHFDSDHTQGLINLFVDSTKRLQTPNVRAGVVHVNKLLVRCNDKAVSKSETKGRLIDAALRAGTTIEVAADNKNYGPEDSPLVLRCIHATNADFGKDENRGSLAFRLEYGGFSYYTAGDLPIADEEAIKTRIKQVDAFKCGHHGSAGSTSETLLASMQPRVAVISCGSNSHGHPTFQVIERLCSKDSAVEGVYLTNCIHNRRCVNPAYEDDEPGILQAYLNLEEMKSHASAFGKIYDKKTINDLLAVLKQRENAPQVTEEEVSQLRKQQKILRAMLIAAAHYEDAEKFKGTKVTAHVGGGPAHFGTITLRVPLAQDKRVPFDVGLFEGEGKTISFRWYQHAQKILPLAYEEANLFAVLTTEVATLRAQGETEKRPISKGITPIRSRRKKKAVVPASNSNNAAPSTSSTAPATPVTKPKVSVMKNSPGTTEPMVLKRWENYARFAVPTLAGLHRHEQKEEVLFCALCRFDADTDEGDFELVEVFPDDEDENTDVWFHRLCYWELCKHLVPEEEREVTIADAYDAERLPLPAIVEGMDTWASVLRKQFVASSQVVEGEPEERITAAIAQMQVQLAPPEDESDSDFEDYS